MADRFDAIVVGAGISGLLSALSLSKEGKKVLLIEGSSVLGGNCRTYEVDGFMVDTGCHAITHMDDGPLPRLMGKYFDFMPHLVPYGNYFVRSNDVFQEFPWTAQAWVKFRILSRKDRLHLAQTIVSAVTTSGFRKQALNKSVFEYLSKNRFSDKTWRFIDTFSYFMSGVSMYETPAWRMLKGAKYLEDGESPGVGRRFRGHVNKLIKMLRYKGSYHQAYPRKGIQSITDCVVNSFARGKVTVKTQERVNSIIVDGGRAFGVETGCGSYNGGFVVFSGYAKDLSSLAGKHLPPEYVKNLSRLRQSDSLTVWLGLERKYPKFNYGGSEVIFEGEAPFWAMPTSNLDPSLAPDGKQIVGFSSVVRGHWRNHKKNLMGAIYSTYPGLQKLVVMEHTQHLVPEKAAISVDARFPEPESPIPGLYLVGTDTDTRSMGVTRAAFSVENLLAALKKRGLV